jgi:hypothetical protein
MTFEQKYGGALGATRDENSNFIIYGLTDPRDGDIRYIGKSTKGLKRPREHGKKGRSNAKCKNWLSCLAKCNLQYGIKILEYCATIEELNYAEKNWIKKGREYGWNLTNLTDGGEGAPGCVKSAATRQKLSKAATERQADPEIRERIRQRLLGHKVSDETKEKIRWSLTGRKLSKDHADNIRKALKGRIFTDDHKQKLREAALRRYLK